MYDDHDIARAGYASVGMAKPVLDDLAVQLGVTTHRHRRRLLLPALDAYRALWAGDPGSRPGWALWLHTMLGLKRDHLKFWSLTEPQLKRAERFCTAALEARQ